MASQVNDFRIDNIVANDTSFVRIIESNPTLSWTFYGVNIVTVNNPGGEIVSVEEVAQSSYEIRIATSNANWGTDSFSTAFLSTGWISSSSQAWRYAGTQLVRGQNYWGQIKVQDAYSNVSNWYQFSFRYNTLPVVDDAIISPITPDQETPLSLSFSISDADGDSDGGSKVRWFVNGSYERVLDNQLTVDASYLKPGDEWSADVTPFDGYEYGNLIATSSVTIISSIDDTTIGNLNIFPASPSVMDPLFADYIYTGNGDVSLQWYVNSSHVTDADNLQFFRFQLQETDFVYFTATIAGIGSLYTSPVITVSDGVFRLFSLKVNGQAEPVNVTTTTPTLTWEVVSPPDRLAQVAQITVGTAAGASDIFDSVVPVGDRQFTVPPNLLKPGMDYYASVAVGDTAETIGASQIAHFRLAGSAWQASANNATGWTVEAVVKVVTDYQGVRIADGTRFVQLDLYSSSLVVTSGAITSVDVDLSSSFNTIVVVGQGTDLSIYVNGNSVIAMPHVGSTAGGLSKTTSDTYIEFGSTSAGEAQWKSIRYTTNGAIYPNTSEFFDFTFDNVAAFNDFEPTALAALNDDILIAVQTPDNTAEIYRYRQGVESISSPTVSKTYSSVNRIVSSPDGLFTFFCHANGATFFKSNPIVEYDGLLNLTNVVDQSDYPEHNGWQLLTSNPSYSTATTTNGLVIDSRSGGNFFYKQNSRGSQWYDGVSNTGWTVDFRLQVGDLRDDSKTMLDTVADGSGIYVNDGAYFETINFTKSQIGFVNANLYVDYDTSVLSDYRLVGSSNSLQLWCKSSTASSYTQIAQVTTSFLASQEGNAGRPSITQDSNSTLHAVWHDDGATAGRQIYYSYRPLGGEWSSPRIIVPSQFNGSNPKIATDGSKLYVVFESHANQNTAVGIVIHNRVGWADPTVLVDNGFDTVNPCVSATTSGALIVAWADSRTGISAIYSLTKSSGAAIWNPEYSVNTSQYEACHPNLDSFNDTAIVAWSEDTSLGFRQIAARAYTFSTNTWTSSHAVGTSSGNDDYCDVLIYYSNVTIVWHSTVSGYSQIWENKLSTNLVSYAGARQLTTGNVNKQFPTIGISIGDNELVALWEQAGGITAAVCTNRSTDTWVSSNLSSHDVSLAFSGTYTCNRPQVAKRFATIAHVLYEGQVVSSSTEHESNADAFVKIRDVLFTLATSSTYTVTEDDQVSALLPTKEIRFGDFSSSYTALYNFYSFGLYLQSAVQPFEIGLVSSGTTPIPEDRSFDALVNDNGDAWLGTQKGLAFYFYDAQTIATFDSLLADRSVYAITISPDGIVIVATDTGLFASIDHVTFVSLSVTGITWATATVKDMLIDGGTLWLATTAGLLGFDVASSLFSAQSAPQSTITVTSSPVIPSTDDCFCIVIDSDSVMWIGTNVGLLRYADGDVSDVFNTDNSGIISDQINGIAIRDTDTRYIATSSGVCEMKFNRFERLTSSSDTHWNNNVKAISFKAPNILWLSTLSDICQIQLDDQQNNPSLVFGIANYAINAVAYDDLRTFYAVGISPASIDRTCLVEVYVNGLKLLGGYVISNDLLTVQFDSPLLVSDIVQLTYRNDITLYASFRQNPAEIANVGWQDKRIEQLMVAGNIVYARTSIEGATKLLSFDDSTINALPFAKIVLDTTPPTGTLQIVSQLSRDQLLVDVEYATDAISGVAEMVVSEYANFTSDGVTPQIPVPFSSTAAVTIGNSLDTGVISKTFASTDGEGMRIILYTPGSGTGVLLAGTRGPAKLLRYSNGTWLDTITVNGTATNTFSTAPGASVDFLIVYGTVLIVGVGVDNGTTTLYSSDDGISFTLFVSLSAPHSYAATTSGNLLFVGGTDGIIWPYDGNRWGTQINTNSSGVNALVALAGSQSTLYAACTNADGGQLLSMNLLSPQNSQQIIFTSSDTSLTAVNLLPSIQGQTNTVNTTQQVYVGTGSSAQIYFGSSAGGVFTESFNSVPTNSLLLGTVSNLRTGGNFTVLAASVDDSVYQQFSLSDGSLSAWQIQAKFVGQELRDFYYTPSILDPTKFDLWAITKTGIYFLAAPSTTNKYLYLRLIDAAGNETPDGAIFASIALSDLTGFVNTNSLLTLDGNTGEQLSSYQGTSPFYSGQKLSSESGEYVSEIFFGTNSLIAWDTIRFSATTPTGTSITLYVRAANSRDTIPAAKWFGGYAQSPSVNQSSAQSISYLSGRYLQFKAVLTSTVSTATPSLSQVVISSKTSEASYFYTTNFILGSSISRGLITVKSVIPYMAQIVCGINTTNSTVFDDYQEITPDQIFVTGSDQTGSGLRIGFKLVTPSPAVYTSDRPTVGSGGEPIHLNVVYKEFSPMFNANYGFRATFYEYSDASLTTPIYTADSTTSLDGWVINDLAITGDGYVLLPAATTSSLLFVPQSTSNLLCSNQYWVKVEITRQTQLTAEIVESNHVFESPCNSSYVSDIIFNFTPPQSHTYKFRVTLFNDPERLSASQVFQYFSGIPWPTGSSGTWGMTVPNGSSYTTLSVSGTAFTNNVTEQIKLHPPSTDFTAGELYYVVVEAFDVTTSTYSVISKDWTFRVNDPVSDITCNGISGVPIVKGFALMFELEDGRIININT
jgi:hypothetical protein